MVVMVKEIGRGKEKHGMVRCFRNVMEGRVGMEVKGRRGRQCLSSGV